MEPGRDRVGLGWRGELAAGIFEHLDRIDVLEVIAEDPAFESRAGIGALAELARMRPLSLHGVTLGLASSMPVVAGRLDRMARLVEQVQPESWSEHLAFVRGSGAGLLLDLHNLQANAVNFGQDPRALLEAMPLERASSVHLAGGRWITPPGGGARRLLDDHLHDVPGEVFDLLEMLASRVVQPLTVIIERDGDFPAFGALLAQLDQARQALARGRARREALARRAA